MNKPNQIIILGGGTSIRNGIELGLWSELDGKFTIGLNYSYKFFQATLQTYVDALTFYKYEVRELQQLPLVVGLPYGIKDPSPNTLLIPATNTYKRDLSNGIFTMSLVGTYALSMAIHLLDEGEIFLLGYDFGNIGGRVDEHQRPMTHFYQGECQHSGIGKTNFYQIKNREQRDFGVFKNEKKVKIWNVSPYSNLTVFEKINYLTFFAKLSPEKYDQNELRDYVKATLKR